MFKFKNYFDLFPDCHCNFLMEASNALHQIKLHYCHEKVLVWEFEDAAIIQKNFRIIGSCIGCFSAKPRQNVQLSLPLILSKIEAKYILSHYNSLLLNSSVFPVNVDLKEYQQKTDLCRKLQFDIQTKIKQNLKWNELDEFADKIKKGKQDKQFKSSVTCNSVKNDKSKTAEPACSKIGLLPHSNEEEFSAIDFDEFKKNELKKVERYGMDQTWIQMPVKSELNLSYTLLSESDLQLSDEENIRYAVFCDLYNQGYYLTDGTKFGGHFLVYPGDPGIYHSSFIVFCVAFKEKISATDYSALGRLATSVKKSLVLCSVDDNGFVIYSSFAWSGLV